MAYEIVSHEKILQAHIFTAYRDEVVLEHGKPTYREYIDRGDGASAILPVDNDGNLIFVRQYRHGARELILEIPAGMLEKDEDPKIAALRELEEETGHKANDIFYMTKMYGLVGFCNEIIYIYYAKNLEITAQNLDPDEFVTIEKYSLEQAMVMIFSGEIVDSKTMIAVMMYNELLKNSKN